MQKRLKAEKKSGYKTDARRPFGDRSRRKDGATPVVAESPLDDVAFGRHAPPDETAYKRTV